jgi:hypothetical protein
MFNISTWIEFILLAQADSSITECVFNEEALDKRNPFLKNLIPSTILKLIQPVLFSPLEIILLK